MQEILQYAIQVEQANREQMLHSMEFMIPTNRKMSSEIYDS